MRKSTRAIFVETPTNPTLRVIDLAPIAQVTKEFGLALLVDGTFASPINLRPIEHGADVVISSATKYLNGHSDVIAGAFLGVAGAWWWSLGVRHWLPDPAPVHDDARA